MAAGWRCVFWEAGAGIGTWLDTDTGSPLAAGTADSKVWTGGGNLATSTHTPIRHPQPLASGNTAKTDSKKLCMINLSSGVGKLHCITINVVRLY